MMFTYERIIGVRACISMYMQKVTPEFATSDVDARCRRSLCSTVLLIPLAFVSSKSSSPEICALYWYRGGRMNAPRLGACIFNITSTPFARRKEKQIFVRSEGGRAREKEELNIGYNVICVLICGRPVRYRMTKICDDNAYVF